MKIDKSVDDLHRRLDGMKPKESIEDDDEDSIAMEARFAMLREARAKKIDSLETRLTKIFGTI